ncbi:hypothetical protein ACMDCT_10220 [Halomonadaceae bacterium KBTZ08]
MSNTPEQRLYHTWLVMALLVTVMGVVALAYNPFPAIAILALGGFCWWRAWLARPGAPAPLAFRLEPDPLPGALGGDVGGRLHPREATVIPDDIEVTLVCARLCEKADHQSVAHRREWVWWETRRAFAQAQGVAFRFEPPASLPGTETRPALSEDQWCCHHYWTLVIRATVDGAPREQRLRLKVAPGNARMERPLAAEAEAVNQPIAQDEQVPTDATLEA